MSIEEKIKYMVPLAERKRRWNALKEKHGALLEERVAAIRSGPWGISRMEARNAVLAELHYDIADTTAALGVEEQTVKNHHAHVREKVAIPRWELEFRMIFLKLLPPEEKIM